MSRDSEIAATPRWECHVDDAVIDAASKNMARIGFMRALYYNPSLIYVAPSAVVEFGQEANRPGDATNAPGHDTEEVTSMPDKLTRLSVAQQRVLDYLLADNSGDFIVVPHAVCGVVGPFEKLLALGLIETEVRPVPIPPGSFDTFYRAVRRG